MTATTADTSWNDFLADGRAARVALICLGVWLNAADSLVTTTIMPSIGRQLGGYAFFSRPEENYYVLSAPVWTPDDRIAFVLSILSREARTDPAVDRTFVDHLLASSARAQTLLAGTTSNGPVSRRR